MQEQNGLRLTLCLVVLLAAAAQVFSPIADKIFHPHDPMTQWVALKPGIDMVGGTSLVYEIKHSEGTPLTGHLASDVADALKRRVDPTGTKNLVWRPQGDERLEIQMPLSADAKGSAEKRRELREQVIAAEDALKSTNVVTEMVIDAVENKNGKTQADLPHLASDSKTRQKLFADLADLWNRIQKAHAAQDAETEAKLNIEFNQKLHPKNAEGQAMRSPIDETNLSREQLDEALAATDTSKEESSDEKQQQLNLAEQNKEIGDFKHTFADFPARLAAIDGYVAAARKYADLKGSLDDATDLKRLLKGAGVLEYHILCIYRNEQGMMVFDMPQANYQKYIAQLNADGPRVHAGDEARWFEVDPKSKSGALTESYNKKRYVLGWITPYPDGKPRSLDTNMPKPWHLADAFATTDQSSGERVVAFNFDPQGAVYNLDMTSANLGKPMAIVLDNKVISAPFIQAKIGGSGIINGGSKGFDEDELSYLVSTLKGGSLPASLSDDPISERTVGPQLGLDNLRAGLVACFLGLVVVAVFLCTYYYLAGFVATCAVIMNVLIVLAVMSFLGATFTLPSIAGIVLSVGTAVDANVLIFERLREEQHRGLSLRMALRNAYGKAFSAIIDSNMTTAITSIILIFLGTEEVKGFGVTLIIGIVASLFTALFVTRTVFSVLMERFGIKHLRSMPLVFPKLDVALRPNWDWMGKAWLFVSFSIVGITVGLSLFFIQVHKGNMMGIEFASGTSVQFELAKPLPQSQLRELMDKRITVDKKVDINALPAFAVVTVGTDATTYEVVTPNSDAPQVRDAILKVLVDDTGKTLLKIDVPSKFDGTGVKEADEINKVIIPLEDKKTPAASAWPSGARPDDYKDYEPGVAIVLNNLDPPLTPAQIADRMRQQKLQMPAGSAASLLDFTVESPTHNAEAPTSTAFILARNSSLPYSKDHDKWEESLAKPLWQLVNDSVNRPAQLQQVKNFDPQVATDATRDALTALIFSILVIMAYIWFRFGNLKYATATMAALVHDILFTVAALGFAHYLWYVPVIGPMLQLEPFRIDLTVVAGILTIMGYSMIDTIVVFDRIRENRGKFGTVSRKVINDAINQTLSRTLLTAGTNIVTVAIMYFLGGPGIHGFTFVLLFGILVGTYSSVAIAAPILLLGRQEEATDRVRGQIRPAGA